MSPQPLRSRLLACAIAIFATGLPAAFLAQPGALFLGNFAFFWLPAVVALLLVAAFRAPVPALYGVAAAICAILLVYGAWVRTIPARESALAWAGYLLCMPGATAGALVSLLWVKFRAASAAQAAFATFIATTGAFAAGMALLLWSGR